MGKSSSWNPMLLTPSISSFLPDSSRAKHLGPTRRSASVTDAGARHERAAYLFDREVPI